MIQFIWVNEIIRGINTIFNVNLLKILTSDQVGVLINRTLPDDVYDYNYYDNIVINYWNVIENWSQN